MANQSSPVWLITGCSTGFGRDLAKTVLARGWRVVVTARQQADIADLIGGAEDRALALALDVTDAAQISAVIKQAHDHFGRIDVLVNNAGYGYQSSVEEGQDAEIRAMFDVNVFGLFAVGRAVLPIMRAQRSGHIINITSVAGLLGYPASGYYAASKHAVEGWSDSLAVETAALGIKVTCIEPGPFRTDFAGRSLKQTKNQIADYADTAGKRMQNAVQTSGQQIGDPLRAAEAIVHITEIEQPPRHFVLGAMGLTNVPKKMRERLAEIEAWREAGLATDFPS